MPVVRSLLLIALLPLFAGCQTLMGTAPDSTAGQVRMQGVLTASGGHLIFQPCHDQRRYNVNDAGNTSILQEAAAQASRPGTIFADVRGRFTGSSAQGADGQVDLQRFYRIQRSATACDDGNFKRATVHAEGAASANQPAWTLNVSEKGMVLERKGLPPLGLPVLEEQLPDGRFDLSSEANGQKIELWVAPQRCADPATGAVQHLSAELRINGVAQTGCGYYGALRND